MVDVDYYYRFGDIPNGSKSAIWQGERCIGHESGISVYEAHCNNDGEYVPVIPYPISEKTLNDYIYYLRYFKGRKFLVTGQRLEQRGTDGEPLLTNIKVIKEL